MEIFSIEFFVIFFVAQIISFLIVTGIKNAIKEYINYLTQMKFTEYTDKELDKHLGNIKDYCKHDKEQ